MTRWKSRELNNEVWIEKKINEFAIKTGLRIKLVDAEDGNGYMQVLLIKGTDKLTIRCQEGAVLGRLSFKA